MYYLFNEFLTALRNYSCNSFKLNIMYLKRFFNVSVDLTTSSALEVDKFKRKRENA